MAAAQVAAFAGLAVERVPPLSIWRIGYDCSWCRERRAGGAARRCHRRARQRARQRGSGRSDWLTGAAPCWPGVMRKATRPMPKGQRVQSGHGSAAPAAVALASSPFSAGGQPCALAQMLSSIRSAGGLPEAASVSKARCQTPFFAHRTADCRASFPDLGRLVRHSSDRR